MAKNVESLYNLLSKMSEKLTDVITDATELNQQAAQYGGEIARIISEQMNQYFIPTITGMVNDLEKPGDIAGIVKFLDSCPLALIREEPAPVTGVPEDIVPTPAPSLDNPAGASERLANPVDELPHNISYNTIKQPASETPVAEAPVEEAPVAEPVMESVMKEAEEVKEEDLAKELAEEKGNWKVVRKSKMAAAIGEELANLDGQCVFEFDSEDEANEKAQFLNDTVLPEEFELFGTEYVVEKSEAPLAINDGDNRDEEKSEIKEAREKKYPIAEILAKEMANLQKCKSKAEIIEWLKNDVYSQLKGSEEAKADLINRVTNAYGLKDAYRKVTDYCLYPTDPVIGSNRRRERY